MYVKLIIILFFWLLFIGFCFLLYKYTAKSQRKTKDVLRKQGLIQQRVSFVRAVSMFFRKTFDYKTRSSMSEYWWVRLFAFGISFISGFIISGAYMFWNVLFFLPELSLLVRRYKDVNISSIIAIAVCIIINVTSVLFNVLNPNSVWILLFILLLDMTVEMFNLFVMLKASNPYKNKYGEIPNVTKKQK